MTEEDFLRLKPGQCVRLTGSLAWRTLGAGRGPRPTSAFVSGLPGRLENGTLWVAVTARLSPYTSWVEDRPLARAEARPVLACEIEAVVDPPGASPGD